MSSCRRFLCLGSLVLWSAASALAVSLTAVDLKCEHRRDPEGLGEVHPRLEWKLEASDPTARGLRQVSYQILVASTPERLAPGKADLWDSGQVASDETREVVYAGAPLASRTACWWSVRVADASGFGSWSAPAHWTMGLLQASEWTAQWIGYEIAESSRPEGLTPAQHARVPSLSWARASLQASKTQPLGIWVRKILDVPKERTLSGATLILVPDQVCAVTVNGKAVGTFTRWDRARPVELGKVLTAGTNVIGLRITQADGYPPAALADLEVRFSSGEPLRLEIDPSWVFTDKAPPSGWDTAGGSGLGWLPLAVIANHKTPWGSPQDATLYLPPAPFFRKGFVVSKPVRQARLYATALGLYEMHLNGERVGRDHMTPGWTDYSERVAYQTYDVTGQLRQGENALGGILGDGWFAGSLAYTGKRTGYGGFPRLRAQLEIDYQDGTREVVATDGTWKAAEGPIQMADIYQGYTYDARRELANWDRPGPVGDEWRPVEVGLKAQPGLEEIFKPGFVTEAASIDPVRTTEELPCKSVATLGDASIADLGQNMVGWARIRVRGKAGQKITVRHGEMLNPNGTVYTSNLRGASATDVYILKGGEELLEPRFTIHGFRYVEVSGLEAPLSKADLTGVVVQSVLERTGDFSSSNPDVNQLFHNIIWGQRGNYLEAPTDCPQRDERLGWTGDTQFFIRTASYNYDVSAFIERWLVTIATDEQGEDGTFPDVAPSIGRHTKAVTAWGDAAIACTYNLWLVYGDTRVVERHFPELARYMGWLQAHAKNGIIRVGGYGDWLNKGGGAKTEVMDTAYYAYLCGLMEDMARAIGKTAYANFYAALKAELTESFQQAFVKPDGSILESSQTGHALAFTIGLLPDNLKAQASDRFVEEIAAHDWHLATGFIGTPRLLPALHLAGRDDVAYRLLLQDTYPSWLFQVKQGATTMWERWDGWTPDQGFQTIDMNSFNHYAFGSVGEYLYRFGAGIDTDGPGFRKILIQPQPRQGLTSARASFDSPSGKIASSWQVSGGKLTLDVTIPVNTVATVTVPTSEPASVTESGVALKDAPGVTLLGRSSKGVSVSVGSGTYHFAASAPAPGTQ